MNTVHRYAGGRSYWPTIPLAILWALGASLAVRPSAQAATNVVIWDAGRPLAGTPDSTSRTDWTLVPSELFQFETDPAKAASDPGYSGREYAFRGDAVVENQRLTAVFRSQTGRVLVYLKADAAASLAPRTSPAAGALGQRILEVAPLVVGKAPDSISRCEVVRNGGDEAVLKVIYSGRDAVETSIVFSFGKDEIIEVKAADSLKGIRVLGAIEYGIIPGFVADDLIVGPSDRDSAEALTLPAENLFVGLLSGEANEIVVTWPKEKIPAHLRIERAAQGKGTFESIDLETGGQSVYVAVLSAPGVWHREDLKPAYLEKDVALNWRRPFPARWKTQLIEAGVRTTFTFRETKGSIWRGVAGSYDYPVWLDGEKAFVRLSKKVPPKGEAIVYFLEGQDTPATMLTPVDVLKATLGRARCEPILDVAGRKLRTHHRRGGEGVHRACTCGCTEAIQAVFEAREEVEQKAYVQEALDDMNYFVQQHVGRIEEYMRFTAGTEKLLQATAAGSPELKPYCDGLLQVLAQMTQEYNVQKDNMKSLEHARDLTRRTMALTARKSPDNLKAYLELLSAWREMGGAQDYVLAQCHTLTRRVFQEAGMRAMTLPNAIPVAQEVKARCRQVLRNPDGYEIWADY